MSNLSDKSNDELIDLKRQCETVLSGIVDALEAREDMQTAIRRLMTPDDILETFSQIGIEDPDVARVTLEAAVAALVNCQSVKAIDAELKQRAILN